MSVASAGHIINKNLSIHRHTGIFHSLTKCPVHVHLPFTFLQISDGAWGKAAVSGTGHRDDSSSIVGRGDPIGLLHSLKVPFARRLLQDSINLGACDVHVNGCSLCISQWRP